MTQRPERTQPRRTFGFGEVVAREWSAIVDRRHRLPNAFGRPGPPCYVKSVDAALRARDATLAGSRAAAEELPDGRSEPSELHGSTAAPAGLAGLALSGGGVRSATFNLGVLQRLHELGILQKLDYLSTVSGGGYIGSALTSYVTAAKADAFPFSARHDAGENFVLRHLRRFSSYLIARGWLDAVVAGMTALGGTLANALIGAPYLLVLAVLAVVQLRVVGSSRSVVLAAALVGIALLTSLLFARAHAAAGARRQSWSERDARGRRSAAIGGLAIAGAVWMVQPVLLELAAEASSELTWEAAAAAATGLAGLAAGALSSGRLRAASLILRRPVVAALLLAAVLALIWLVFVALGIGMYRLDGALGTPAMVLAGLAAAALLLLIGRFLPTNSGSLHGFYRDRLSKAYLFKPWRPDAQSLEQFDDCQLSEIDVVDSPYLLINACLNVSDTPGRREDLTKEYLRPGRRGAFFLFSRNAVGNDSLGYLTASDFEAVNELSGSLATAMAISGAALGANMGYSTHPAAVFLLTLLNVRTGCWVSFPGGRGKKTLLQRLLGDYAYLTLCREAVSRFDSDAGRLLLSDGGHIDNLGLYQLLRRRCMLIIASDAEADPGYAFEGLAAAVRLAKIDLDVAVEIDHAHLAAISKGKRHFAVGRIRYPDGRAGTLILLKSSLTEEALRDVSLLYYHRSNASFPHESTADQFFTEQQFEAYRSLGHFVCMKTFEGPEPP